MVGKADSCMEGHYIGVVCEMPKSTRHQSKTTLLEKTVFARNPDEIAEGGLSADFRARFYRNNDNSEEEPPMDDYNQKNRRPLTTANQLLISTPNKRGKPPKI